jgi:hypothetical protein
VLQFAEHNFWRNLQDNQRYPTIKYSERSGSMAPIKAAPMIRDVAGRPNTAAPINKCAGVFMLSPIKDRTT